MGFELVAAYQTDPGLVRETNQDWAEIFRADDAALAARKGDLFLVADGMGGHASGEQVSKFAVQKVAHVYRRDPSRDVKASLERAIAQANAEIYREATSQVGETGAGTTMVGLVLRGERAFVVNIGDSRAYRVRAGHIEQITRDHSWVAEQARAGRLTEQQGRRHALRSTITRAVGMEPDVTPDFFELDVQPGDTFLLCTDGLTRHVSDANIQTIVAQYPPEEAASRLVQLARQRGGTDNVTAMVVEVRRSRAVAGFPLSELLSLDRWRRRVPHPTLIIVGAAVIALLLLCALATSRLRRESSLAVPLVEPPVPSAGTVGQAPIQYRIQGDTHVKDLARHFGYRDAPSFVSAIGPEQREKVVDGYVLSGTELLVEPARSYFLVGGQFNAWIETADGTLLELVGETGRYRVPISGAALERDEGIGPEEGELLRVFSVQLAGAEGKPVPSALLIQKRDETRSAWISWYISEALPEDEVWVYGSLTEGSFGRDIIAATQHSGKPVAVYGRWVRGPEVGTLAFRWDEWYILNAEGNAYVPAGQPAEERKAQPTRQPTATLRPTEAPGR